MKYINKLILAVVLTVFSVSCTDSYDCKLEPEKPGDASWSEYLNSYDLLKNYANKGTDSPFNLGVYFSPADFLSKEFSYSMVCTNFQALETGSFFTPVSIVGDDGTIDVSSLQMLVEETKNAEIVLYGPDLLSHKQQKTEYLNKLIAPALIPGDFKSGVFWVNDFESDILGTTYPMTGNSAATVVADPAGQSGNVLNVGNAQTPASQSFPQFNVTLPDGVTLGNCVSMIMDFNASGSTGLFGSGMRMGVNEKPNASYSNASSFGCPDGSWGRDKISLPFSSLDLTDAEKQLTTFTLKVGSATGSGNYYMDNIRIYWEIGEDDQIIEKTPEEKKSILSEELNKWIGKMMDAGGETVKAWNIVANPLDKSSVDENTFQWKDYLGDPDYARIAVKMVRDTAQVDLDLFVSHSSDLSLTSALECEDLITLIEAWEADNVTRIDGIALKLNFAYSFDPVMQEQYQATFESILRKLAETGKLIRISELYVRVTDAGGVTINTSNLTTLQEQAISLYYEYLIRRYFEIIPTKQCYGISFGAPVDATQTIGLWDTKYNRKHTYAGVANGLSGK